MMAENRFLGSEEIRAVFKSILITANGYYSYIVDQVAALLFLMDVRNENYKDGFLYDDRTQTNVGKVPATANTIFIHLLKPNLYLNMCAWRTYFYEITGFGKEVENFMAGQCVGMSINWQKQVKIPGNSNRIIRRAQRSVMK